MFMLFLFAFVVVVALTVLAYWVRHNPIAWLAAGFAWVMFVSKLLQTVWMTLTGA